MSFVSKSPFQLTGRYAHRNKWEVLAGPGDSRVTGLQIIQDEQLTDAWKDKVVVITGVSSGIGVETVRALAKTGATVYGTARNTDKAKEALGDWMDTGRVKLLYMDQTHLESVRACATEFRKQSTTLNVVINNAAVSRPQLYNTRHDMNQPTNMTGNEHPRNTHKPRLRSPIHHQPPLSLPAFPPPPRSAPLLLNTLLPLPRSERLLRRPPLRPSQLPRHQLHHRLQRLASLRIQQDRQPLHDEPH